MTATIYHNPRCSKSRQTLELLRENGQDPVIVEYLNDTPDAATLRDIIARLGVTPRDIMRKKEAPYAALGLDDAALDDEALILAMVENPVLIERPIVLNKGKAALGRPPESVLSIL